MAEDSFESYKDSGFGQTDGAKELQKTANSIPTTNSQLKKEAIAQYKPTYELEQQSLTNQLSALIKSQTSDSELLNKSYQQSVNNMMAKLQQRGLGTDVHAQTTEAALHKFHNEVMTERNIAYDIQRSGIEERQKTLKANYNQNILARVSQNKLNNLKNQTQLLTQIADIQNNSYQNYINYLLAKQQRSRSGGGGGGRRYYGGGRRYYGGGGGGGRRYYGGGSGGSGAAAGAPASAPGSLPDDYFTDNGGSTGPGPGLLNLIGYTVNKGARAIAHFVQNSRKK